MVWYCVEERHKPISEYGRFRRRFLNGNKFTIYANSHLEQLEINKVNKKIRVYHIYWAFEVGKFRFFTSDFTSSLPTLISFSGC